MRVLVVVGTRPEAIKMAPVVLGLREAGVEVEVATTGQHPELAAQGLAAFDLAADHALPRIERAEEDLAALLLAVVERAADLYRVRKPDLVLVHGDTTSALGAGLASHHLRIPLGHVEAGLRTGDRSAPFPEEDNRVLLDRLASLWFAPTQRAKENVVREGAPADRVLVTGNPVVDAVSRMRERVERLPCAAFPELAPLGLDEPGHVIALTAHRRESLGAPLMRVCAALPRIAGRVVWPVHPNPEIAKVLPLLARAPNVTLCEPLSYPAMVRLLLRSALVLTDSGGIQEEAVVLGRSTLVLRENTERPEVLDTGIVRLVGTATDRIVAESQSWLKRSPTFVATDQTLGDGHAGIRIARWIAAAFAG